MSAPIKSSSIDPLSSGHAALAQGNWQEARDCYMAALEREETAEVLESLGMATWWLSDAATTFDVRERAYRLYQQQRDARSAARVAICLALDYYLFRGEHAVVSGWFQIAHRLLANLDPGPEHALIGIWEGYVALTVENDIATAQRLSENAAELARSLEMIDLEMLAQALNGLALVSAGHVNEGMRLLDEATAVALAGDMTDLDAIVTTCCFLIYACERVRDYDRSVQWCNIARQISERWSYRFMFSFCQVHYASVLIWCGAWDEAEAELLEASTALSISHPAMAGESLTRLAELRRRQGRLEEASALLLQAESHPLAIVSGKYVLLGRAALTLDQGDPTAAAEHAERFLRRVQPEDRLESVAGLELLVRAQAALGQHAQAAATLGTLQAISAVVDTPPLRASVSFSEGVVAAAAGDLERARQRFEDAADLFKSSGAPYESALACLELASVLVGLNRNYAAANEAEAALKTLQSIGASRETARASAFLIEITSARHGHTGNTNAVSCLTRRETEVLQLVAQGMTDKELALTLSLSEHTIHRHIANILTKLDLPSRSAAVAHATRQGII